MRLLRRLSALLLTSAIFLLEQSGVTINNWLRAMRLYRTRLPAGSKVELAESKVSTGMPADCLQTIIDSIEDEVMIIGSDLRIKQANNAILRRLGTTAADIAGQPCFKVSHSADEPCHLPWCECPLNQVLETGQSIRTVHTLPESQGKEDGERWLEVVASPLRNGAGNVTEVIELVRDVSENKRLQREIFRANRELLALNSIARALSQSLDLKTTLQTAAEAILDALEVQVSWIRLANAGGIPTVRASRGLSAQILDDLAQTVASTGFDQETTSATYSIVPGNNTGEPDQLWQFAVTPLKSKGAVLGIAGVGTTKQPVDQQRIQLLDAIGHQIAVAVERCQLYEEVQLSRDLRGELLHKVITAQEEERRRIARELHDETGQFITALRLGLERLALTSESSTVEKVKAQLAQSLSLCQRAEEEIDKLIFDLRPSLLDDLGLVEAIEFYTRTRLAAAGIEAKLIVTGDEKRLTSEREVSLFRVIQEGINNIIRHAHAKSVTIRLRFNTSNLEARIEDDGCGFDVNRIVSPQSPGRGLGLLGMKERMNLVGGSLTITSRAGMGTRIKVIVPFSGDGVKA